MEKKKIFAIFIVLVVVIEIAFLIGNLIKSEHNSSFGINESKTSVGVNTAQQLQWNGINLIDSKICDYRANLCVAEANNMRFESPANVSDIDGKDIEVWENYTWNGNSARNVTFIQRYSDDLESGAMFYFHNKSLERKIYFNNNTWINNYLVQNVANYTNLSVPDSRCQIGNANNTKMYNVTFSNLTSVVYCFSNITTINATAFRISGNVFMWNYNVENYYQYVWDDVTRIVTPIGRGLLGGNDTGSYYETTIELQPHQSYYIKRVFTPKNHTKKGSWSVFMYSKDLDTLYTSIQNGRYVYSDPNWNDDWAYCRPLYLNITGTGTGSKNQTTWYKNITYKANMSYGNFSDLRIVNEDNSSEMGIWFYNNTIYQNNSVMVAIRLDRNVTGNANISLLECYGNPTAQSVSNIENAFMFADDFNLGYINNTKWNNGTQTFSVVNGVFNVTGCASCNAVVTAQNYSDVEAVTRVADKDTNNNGQRFVLGATKVVAMGSSDDFDTYQGNYRPIMQGATRTWTGIAYQKTNFTIMSIRQADLGYDNANASIDAVANPFNSPISANGTIGGSSDWGSTWTPTSATGTYFGMSKYDTGSSTANFDWIYIRPLWNGTYSITEGAEFSNAGGEPALFPSFTNYSVIPNNNSQYVQGATYSFNITIFNSTGNSYLEFDGVNVTMSNISTMFNASVIDKKAGNHTAKFIASNGANYNTTSYAYVILQANSTSVLTITPNTNISYPAVSNFSCSNNYLNMTLFIDGVDTTLQNNQNVIRKVGTYNVECNATGNENYTGDFKNRTYYILKGTPPISLSVNPSGIVTNNTIVNATGSGCPAQLICNLTLNGTQISNPNVTAYYVGNYTFNYTAYSNENYSYVSILRYLNVTTLPIVAQNGTLTLVTYSYPYVDFNTSYYTAIGVIVNGSSRSDSDVYMNITSPDGNVTTLTYVYNAGVGLYEDTIIFTEVGDYNFTAWQVNALYNIDSISGTFKVRVPYWITIEVFKDGNSTKYVDNFGVVTAELPHMLYGYDTNLETFLRPTFIKYDRRTKVFHTPYTNGEATIKLYENSTHILRLVSGKYNFESSYAVPNITKTYSSAIYLGAIYTNGTNQTYEYLVTDKDIHPFTWLWNVGLIVLLVAIIGISIVLLFVFPEYPFFSFVFGLSFTIMLIILRLVLWLWGKG